MSLGFGGVSLVHRASGLSRQAITRGIREIKSGKVLTQGRARRSGAGRKSVAVSDPNLLKALEAMIEGSTRGDPESPLRWICKSTRTIGRELERRKHPISHVKVGQILHDQHYSLQSNRKTEEGADHHDRDAQFRHIAPEVKSCLRRGVPVISVDTKKKELVGNYENNGRQWQPAKVPVQVQGHDFPGRLVPRAYPYGIYDIGRNVGFVNVGTDHDTGAFAVASIRGWWRAEGKRIYAKAGRILITADGGGSNGARLRLLKHDLQKFANETGLRISVCHFPPGKPHEQLLWVGAGNGPNPLGTAPVPYPTAVLQMDQTAPADQGVLRNLEECRQEPNLDRRVHLRARGDRTKAAEAGGVDACDPADSELDSVRENLARSSAYAPREDAKQTRQRQPVDFVRITLGH